MEASWLETRWARPLYLAFVFCLALGLLQAIKLYLRRQRLLRDLRAFPAPPTHWFYGHQKFLQEDKMEKLEETVEKYPCAFPCWVGPFQAFFFIYDPDYAKTFLSRTDPKSQYPYRFMTPCLGKGLLNLDGPKWFQHRRLLTPGFHCDILKTYVDMMAHSVNTMLAENEDSFSNADLRSEVNTFMLAGHDTSAVSLSWLLYCLALNPEHQERCREEIRSILGDGSSITWDQLGEMSYTTMCIKEMFRLIPPVPSISRELSKPLTFPDGRSLPAGITVVLSIWGLHHNPAVWKSPKIFDPLRFTKENSDQRHPYAFLPFSSGPRNCIGEQFAILELKVAIALILLHFKVTPDLTRPPVFSNHIILKPKHGIHLHLKKLPEC
ncbi:cytochrome P450 4X1, transcript variant X3 [Ictidomys tridecemlineatus]|nr:cytochrome P450 4X1, transcript variant X3 [Ictidomys tridecemlineatus]